jgi:glycosyltransferase involved in cell wall biosynthesis
MRPHVLYITPMFGYPPFGGPRLRTYNTLLALARCADVSLFLTNQPDTRDRAATEAHLHTFLRDVVMPPAPPPPPGGLMRTIARTVLPESARAKVRQLRSRSPAVAEAPADRDPAQVEAIVDWIAEHQPDVIWLGFSGISYDLVPLKERTGLPLVLETECVWSRFILRELPFVSDPAQRAAIQQAGAAKEAEERFGALHADITTAVSDVDAEYFQSLAPDATTVMQIANVIDVDAYQGPSERVDLRQPALVFAGSFSRGTANVDATSWLVDDVMPLVWSRRPDAHVYLVGRDPAPEVNARKGQRVHVTGEVPSIVPYLRACAAALVPLRWESGTRFKILEAFACRAPVISTTLGAEGLAVTNGEDIVLADDTAAFAGAILSLLDEPERGERLTDRAYDLVRRDYDVSSAARQSARVLARLGLAAPVGV